MEKPLHVFCCYARPDQSYLLELKKRLIPLQRDGWIVFHADIDISPGENWEQKISHYLNTAHVILLLISPDFIASDYCYSKEMARALERHDKGDVYVIPIILRPTDLRRMPFSKIQSLPKDAKPITNWDKQDDAFLNVTTGIEEILQGMLSLSFPEIKPSSVISVENSQLQETFHDQIRNRLAKGNGALIVYEKNGHIGRNIALSSENDQGQWIEANIVARTVNGRLLAAAVFPGLKPDSYHVFQYGSGSSHYESITVLPEQVTEIDWRERKPRYALLAPLSMIGLGGLLFLASTFLITPYLDIAGLILMGLGMVNLLFSLLLDWFYSASYAAENGQLQRILHKPIYERLTEGNGALVIYEGSGHIGENVTLSPKDDQSKKINANIVARAGNGHSLIGAIFPNLMPGSYSISGATWHSYEDRNVTVFPRQIAEMDWRGKEAEKKKQRRALLAPSVLIGLGGGALLAHGYIMLPYLTIAGLILMGLGVVNLLSSFLLLIWIGNNRPSWLYLQLDAFVIESGGGALLAHGYIMLPYLTIAGLILMGLGVVNLLSSSFFTWLMDEIFVLSGSDDVEKLAIGLVGVFMIELGGGVLLAQWYMALPYLTIAGFILIGLGIAAVVLALVAFQFVE